MVPIAKGTPARRLAGTASIVEDSPGTTKGPSYDVYRFLGNGRCGTTMGSRVLPGVARTAGAGARRTRAAPLRITDGQAARR